MESDGNCTNLTSKKFISFNEYLGLPMEGFEKEADSQLRKLEAQEGHIVVGSSFRRRPPASRFKRDC